MQGRIPISTFKLFGLSPNFFPYRVFLIQTSIAKDVGGDFPIGI